MGKKFKYNERWGGMYCTWIQAIGGSRLCTVQYNTYDKTWAGVVKPSSFRLLFRTAAECDLYMEQMDGVKAFFYDFLDEDIFLNQGYGTDALICHLRKLSKLDWGLVWPVQA